MFFTHDPIDSFVTILSRVRIALRFQRTKIWERCDLPCTSTMGKQVAENSPMDPFGGIVGEVGVWRGAGCFRAGIALRFQRTKNWEHCDFPSTSTMGKRVANNSPMDPGI